MYKILYQIEEFSIRKKYFLALTMGILFALAFAPTYYVFFGFISFPILILLINNINNHKQSFWIGWFFGAGYFIVSLYWISIALLIDIEQFWYLFPLAIFGIGAVLAFYIAITTSMLYLSKSKYYRQIIIFAVIWTLLEYLRGHLFSGFPWNKVGYIWAFSDKIIQITSVFGILGLSFLSIIIFSMPIIFYREGAKKAILLPILLLALIYAYGSSRLNSNKTLYTDITTRIVQPNISQFEKWDANKQTEILMKLFKISSQNSKEKIDLIIWPESAVPYAMNDNIANHISRIIPEKTNLITGAIRAKYNKLGNSEQLWNSIFVINDKGSITNIYDKSHLVPFGEYVPFKSILPFKKITAGIIDFSKGDGVKSINIDNKLLFSPLVCYEAIFSGAVIDNHNIPDVMVNLTNDAWYGNSSGPYQHFDIVKIRAIEEGIPLIRAANNGISGVIDSFGRVLTKTKLNATTYIDIKIPKILPYRTLFSKYKHIPLIILILFFTLIAYLIKNE